MKIEIYFMQNLWRKPFKKYFTHFKCDLCTYNTKSFIYMYELMFSTLSRCYACNVFISYIVVQCVTSKKTFAGHHKHGKNSGHRMCFVTLRLHKSHNVQCWKKSVFVRGKIEGFLLSFAHKNTPASESFMLQRPSCQNKNRLCSMTCGIDKNKNIQT